MKKNFFVILISVILIGASFAAGFLIKNQKSSAAAPLLLPFGGELWSAEWCECSATFDLFYSPIYPLAVFPVAGAWLGYDPALTVVYAQYNMITPGVWHLGQFIPELQTCWSFHRSLCFPVGDEGAILQVGTSLTPSPAS